MDRIAPRVMASSFLFASTFLLAGAPALAQLATPQPPASKDGASEGYILGPNDEIEMTVYGQQGMTTRTRVGADGTVSVPFLGAVRAQGITPAQFARSLAGAYTEGGYLSRPSINVEVTNYVSRAATVLGNVPNAGNYPLDRPYSVATLIARAGGVRPDGANVVMLTSAGGGETVRLPLADPNGALTRQVSPGDTLFVPPAENVYVYGQVNAPGAFPFQAGMTYRQALARAGGPTLAGSTRRIEVRRGGEGIKGLKLDEPILPEDVLIIREKLF